MRPGQVAPSAGNPWPTRNQASALLTCVGTQGVLLKLKEPGEGCTSVPKGLGRTGTVAWPISLKV